MLFGAIRDPSIPLTLCIMSSRKKGQLVSILMLGGPNSSFTKRQVVKKVEAVTVQSKESAQNQPSACKIFARITYPFQQATGILNANSFFPKTPINKVQANWLKYR